VNLFANKTKKQAQQRDVFGTTTRVTSERVRMRKREGNSPGSGLRLWSLLSDIPTTSFLDERPPHVDASWIYDKVYLFYIISYKQKVKWTNNSISLFSVFSFTYYLKRCLTHQNCTYLRTNSHSLSHTHAHVYVQKSQTWTKFVQGSASPRIIVVWYPFIVFGVPLRVMYQHLIFLSLLQRNS